jgi:hypothetical protein
MGETDCSPGNPRTRHSPSGGLQTHQKHQRRTSAQYNKKPQLINYDAGNWLIGTQDQKKTSCPIWMALMNVYPATPQVNCFLAANLPD